MYSGGVGSYSTAKRVVQRHGPENVLLIFADTQIEDEDLYRFLLDTSEHLGADLEILSDGRDPWEVFKDVKFLGNSRIDPCSKLLKRDLIRNWLETNCDPAQTVIYLGIDWTESHRFENAKKYWGEWEVSAPMCEAPYLQKSDMLDALREDNIEVPRLYSMGFPHNNCGGFCVKAGESQFHLLLKTMPERYKHHEQKEQEVRDLLDKDVAILRDRATGDPMTMKAFREKIEAGADPSKYEWGGCGCFSPTDPSTLPVSSLPLNIAQINTLEAEGITELWQVSMYMDEGPLTRIKGIGPKTEELVQGEIERLLWDPLINR